MAFPEFIDTRQVSFGGAASIESGTLLTARVSVSASRALIDIATGFRLERLTHSSVSVLGGEVLLELPVTNRSGYLDADTGLEIEITDPDQHTHTYVVELSIQHASETIHVYTIGPFVVPAGPGVIDGDTMLVPSESEPGILVTPGQITPEMSEMLGDTEDARDAAENAQLAAEQAQGQAESARDEAVLARDETVVAVSASADWSGAVSLAAVDSRSSYLVRRLTGNVTLTVEAGEAGVAYSCTLELSQDSTGSRNLTVANTATAYAVPIVLSAGANARDLLHLLWNGSSWSALLGAANLGIPASWVVV